MKRPGIRSFLLIFLLMALAFPLLQSLCKITSDGKKLEGDVHYASNAAFSWKGWWNGDYQELKTAYINDSIGFRPAFVRMNNELNYLLFHKFYANGAILGTDHYLYESGYISAYRGDDFLGDTVIAEKFRKLKYIQDTLARAGKKLVLIFTPSKARFYPEHLPPGDFKTGQYQSNYPVMLDYSRRFNINTIDVNGWFVNMKKTAPHPLFSHQGTHWTVYGAIQAQDSINKYLGHLTGVPIRQFVLDSMQCTTTPRDADDDIGKGLNLLWPIVKEELCYPCIHFEPDTTDKKTQIIFISDSFFWVMLYTNIPKFAYKDWQSWFYFNEMWNEGATSGRTPVGHVAGSDWPGEINKTDVVVLMITEANLSHFGWGFVEQAYDRYQRK